MKFLVKLLGFDWIANQTARKVVRIVVNIGIAAVAGAHPAATPILSVVGLTPGPEAVAAAGALLGAVEAFRNEAKHN